MQTPDYPAWDLNPGLSCSEGTVLITMLHCCPESSGKPRHCQNRWHWKLHARKGVWSLRLKDKKQKIAGQCQCKSSLRLILRQWIFRRITCSRYTQPKKKELLNKFGYNSWSALLLVTLLSKLNLLVYTVYHLCVFLCSRWWALDYRTPATTCSLIYTLELNIVHTDATLTNNSYV